MTSPRTHLSKSMIGSLDRCNFAFLQHYGLGLNSPPSWKMHAGSAIDTAASADYRQKIKSHTNLPSADVAEMAVVDFRQRNRAEPTTWDHGITEDAAVDHIAEATQVFHAEIMEQVQPVTVQEPVSVAFEGMDWTFDGFVDVRAEQGILSENKGGFCIIDIKGTAKSGGWKADDVAAAMDPYAYDLGLRARGIQIDSFEFHVARFGSGSKFLKQKSNQILPVEVTDEARAGFLKLLVVKKQQADQILTSGVGAPTYSWACKGCGFRDACRKEWGRTPPGGDGGDE